MRWTAIECIGMMGAGRTGATLLRCVRDGGEEEADLVVKDTGGHEVTPESICRELAGNVMARVLGVNTPEPALVWVPRDVAWASRFVVQGRGPLAEGWAAGAVKFGPGAPVPQGISLTGDLLRQAMCLYAFDLVAKNPDHRADNANCVLLGDALLAYDFEFCFMRTSAVLAGGEPWQVAYHHRPEHVLRRPIASAAKSRDRYSWEPFLSSLSGVDEERTRELLNWLPSNCCSVVESIVSELAECRDHLEDLERHLEQSLS